MLARIRRIARHVEDKGSSAVEYGLMVAAISAVIVGAVFALGGIIKTAFSETCRTVASSVVAGDDTCGPVEETGGEDVEVDGGANTP